MNSYGAQSMTAQLRKVLVREPPAAMGSANPSDWGYRGSINLSTARAEHAALVKLLVAEGVEVHVLGECPEEFPDSVFAFDASLVTRGGAILMRMGKVLRRAETDLHRRLYERADVPILGGIEPPGVMEAGDVLWVNERLVVVGRGFRTNDAGILQLQHLLEPLGVEVDVVDLPAYGGPEHCMHLMSLVSILGPDLALVEIAHAPVRLLQLLERSGICILAAPPDEFFSSNTVSANVLVLSARRCVTIAGMPRTRELLEGHDCVVMTFPGAELCLKAEGGPTCLTRPLLRAEP
jgi:dimethylargininase